MKHLPENTLAFFNAAPQTQLVNVGELPISVLAKSMKTYSDTCGLANPDHEAIKFYCLNHYASLVRKRFTVNETLPEWAVKLMARYIEELAQQSQRQLYYLLYITTREARHLKHNSVPDGWHEKVEELYGSGFSKFYKGLTGDEHGGVKLLTNNPPKASTWQYVAGTSHLFNKGKWSSQFGGKKWGQISDCLLAFVSGKVSLEMMVDTAYTLSHNNGPIYNKGLMYSSYSGQFIKILDMQRAGQIPAFMRDNQSWGLSKPSELKEYTDIAYEHFADDLNTYVDWYQVEALGSKHKYSLEKEKQDKLHPKSQPIVKLGKFNMVPTGETFETGLFGEEVAVLERVA